MNFECIYIFKIERLNFSAERAFLALDETIWLAHCNRASHVFRLTSAARRANFLPGHSSSLRGGAWWCVQGSVIYTWRSFVFLCCSLFLSVFSRICSGPHNCIFCYLALKFVRNVQASEPCSRAFFLAILLIYLGRCVQRYTYSGVYNKNLSSKS